MEALVDPQRKAAAKHEVLEKALRNREAPAVAPPLAAPARRPLGRAPDAPRARPAVLGAARGAGRADHAGGGPEQVVRRADDRPLLGRDEPGLPGPTREAG